MKTKEELRLLFENGDKPTQENFWEWLDSYWHKDEKISDSSVDSVERVIPVIIDGVILGHSTSISTPKNVKKINQGSFQWAGMNYPITEVNFNEGLEEIGPYAFQSQNVLKIKTPSTLKVIDNAAFDGQMNLINGNIVNELVPLEEIILNEGLIRIGDYAFKCTKAKIKNLYIPSTVQHVGINAFEISSLQVISAPAGLDLSNAGIPATATITYR